MWYGADNADTVTEKKLKVPRGTGQSHFFWAFDFLSGPVDSLRASAYATMYLCYLLLFSADVHAALCSIKRVNSVAQLQPEIYPCDCCSAGSGASHVM